MKAQTDYTEFNRLALACSSHRMQMISSERVLVNPKYDNGTEEPSNVKEYHDFFKCIGSCQQVTQLITPNK